MYFLLTVGELCLSPIAFSKRFANTSVVHLGLWIEGQQEHCEQADGEDGKIKEKEIEGENQTEQNAEENAAENEATSNVYGENSQPDHELAGSSPSDDKDSKSEASGNEKMGSGQEDTEGETPRDEYKGREETKWKQTEGSDSENEYAKMQQAEDGQKEDSWKENAFHIFKKRCISVPGGRIKKTKTAFGDSEAIS